MNRESNNTLLPNNVVRKHTLEGKSLLQAWREHLNFTQEEIAKAMQISQSAYSQLEARKNHRASTLERLAELMSISPEQLLLDE